MTTRNVRDFGAVGDNVTDDYAAFAAAVATLLPGDTLYAPTGTYRISFSGSAPITLPDDCILRGDGPTASVLRRDCPNALQLVICGSGNVVEDIGMEMAAAINFSNLIHCPTGPGLTVRRCKLTSNNVPPGDGVGGTYTTLHAILAHGIDDVLIEDVETYQVQIKVGGSRIVVRDILSVDPHNYTVSAVLSTDERIYRDMVFERITCHGMAGTGCIYVGSDFATTPLGELHDVLIQNVTIDGEHPLSAVGVQVRFCRVSSNLVIRGVSYNNDLGAIPNSNSIGVLVQSPSLPGAKLTGCGIIGCRVFDTDQAGIALDGEIDQVTVRDNVCVNTRGITLLGLFGGLGPYITAVNNSPTAVISGVLKPPPVPPPPAFRGRWWRQKARLR
jgi:hypothetical protein